MSNEVVSGVVVGSNKAASAGNGAEMALDLNQGFLGTGASTMVELSYLAMLAITLYVAHGTLKYFMPELSISAKIFGALGLRD